MSRLPSAAWTVRQFLDQLGSAKPVPGGGSAAAMAAALGVELGNKVGRIVLSRRRLSPMAKRRIQRDLKTLAKASTELRRLIREDSQAYSQLIRALANKRGISAATTQRLHLVRPPLAAARRRAIQCPLRICEAAVQGMRVLRGFSASAGPYLASDLESAEALLQGSFRAARLMVEVNLRTGLATPREPRCEAGS